MFQKCLLPPTSRHPENIHFRQFSLIITGLSEISALQNDKEQVPPLWIVKPSILVGAYRRFGKDTFHENYGVHLQDYMAPQHTTLRQHNYA